MSFSSDIKTELLENLSKEKNIKYLNAEKYGENLTEALTKASLSSEFKEFLNISNFLLYFCLLKIPFLDLHNYEKQLVEQLNFVKIFEYFHYFLQ